MISGKTFYALRRLVENSGTMTAPDSNARHFASVVLPVFEKNSILHILAILKADNGGYPWSNQVALPGGHIDKTDTNALFAGLRELKEELGITPPHIIPVGSMGHFQTILNTDIEVFVATWDAYDDEVAFDRKEISEIFHIPLPELADHHASAGFSGRIPPIDELIYPFQGLEIWGVTARILHFFIEGLLPDFFQTPNAS
ncbi:MAG: CoA pyrophosphatase [Deltaproteobacteria bacterium]|nr:CoA pyrophosphatase [Deltaproteobacteria bacterium]